MIQHIDKTLSEFGKCCLSVATLLQNDEALNHLERLFLENHLTIIQLNYSAWKRRHEE